MPSYAFSEPTQPALKTLGAAKGLRVGSAMGMPTYSDRRYRELLARECATLVTENECKWQYVSPKHGEWQFDAADELLGWAAKQGLMRRGHCLVWQPTKWLPQWVNEYDFGTQPALTAEKLLTERINGMMKRYGSQIYSWDVVNEAIEPKTGEYRDTVLARAMGTVDQLDFCFRLAREQAPKAQLVYNDFMHWNTGSAKHRAGVLKLLHALKAKGTPVDALGLQSHIGADEGDDRQQEWRKFLDEVSGMGLQLLITEFDVNDRTLPADIAARDAGVAAMTRDYLDVTLSYTNLTDFLFWGLTNNTSWLQSHSTDSMRKDKLPLRCCPFDDAYQPTAIHDAVAASLRSMPVRRS